VVSIEAQCWIAAVLASSITLAVVYLVYSYRKLQVACMKQAQAKRKSAQKIVVYPPDPQPLPEARVVNRDKRSHNIVE
jgi:hypothetical protein